MQTGGKLKLKKPYYMKKKTSIPHYMSIFCLKKYTSYPLLISTKVLMTHKIVPDSDVSELKSDWLDGGCFYSPSAPLAAMQSDCTRAVCFRIPCWALWRKIKQLPRLIMLFHPPPPSLSSPSPPFMINYSVNIICWLNRNRSMGPRNCVSLLMRVDTHLQ